MANAPRDRELISERDLEAIAQRVCDLLSDRSGQKQSTTASIHEGLVKVLLAESESIVCRLEEIKRDLPDAANAATEQYRAVLDEAVQRISETVNFDTQMVMQASESARKAAYDIFSFRAQLSQKTDEFLATMHDTAASVAPRAAYYRTLAGLIVTSVTAAGSGYLLCYVREHGFGNTPLKLITYPWLAVALPVVLALVVGYIIGHERRGRKF